MWRDAASCRHVSPEHFFSPPGVEERKDRKAREHAARALCDLCPVRQQCLDFSLETQEQHGIWGGLNNIERRRLVRDRQGDRCAAD